MKSPLVEALRQATGSGDAEETGAAEAATEETLGHEFDREISLEPARGEQADSLDFLSVDDTPDAAAGGTDIDLVESLELQVANDDDSRDEADGGGLIETGVLPAPPATRPSRAPRIALLAPLICLGAALASGALHFTVRWIAGGHENPDLAVMSGQEIDGTGIPAHDSLLAPPTRFKLVVDQAAAHPRNSHEERLRARLPAIGTASP